eukprot:1142338-Pelagomonas_calceolata.AAC.3
MSGGAWIHPLAGPPQSSGMLQPPLGSGLSGRGLGRSSLESKGGETIKYTALHTIAATAGFSNLSV